MEVRGEERRKRTARLTWGMQGDNGGNGGDGGNGGGNAGGAAGGNGGAEAEPNDSALSSGRKVYGPLLQLDRGSIRDLNVQVMYRQAQDEQMAVPPNLDLGSVAPVSLILGEMGSQQRGSRTRVAADAAGTSGSAASTSGGGNNDGGAARAGTSGIAHRLRCSGGDLTTLAQQRKNLTSLVDATRQLDSLPTISRSRIANN